MSISRTQIQEFANYVGRHPALTEFVARMDKKIYDKFTKATTEEKRIHVGYMYDAFTEVITEFKDTIDEMRQAKADKEEDQ